MFVLLKFNLVMVSRNFPPNWESFALQVRDNSSAWLNLHNTNLKESSKGKAPGQEVLYIDEE
jgi:hypothetical protein